MGLGTVFVLLLPSFADPPNDSLGRFARVDWIAAIAIVDPDHNQPTAGRRPADHLVRLRSARTVSIRSA